MHLYWRGDLPVHVYSLTRSGIPRSVNASPCTFPAYFLGGATATGKTEVAHLLAARMNLPVLSADSMLVYVGMDIGTAKPTPVERGDIAYFGLDLVDPSREFSSADWLSHVAAAARDGAFHRGVIVVGGTGLYFKLLHEGLSVPGATSHFRAELDALFALRGIDGLRDRLEQARPGAVSALADPFNPRRLIRAIEIAESGVDDALDTTQKCRSAMTALHHDRAILGERISRRVEAMFTSGLEHEVALLLNRHPVWSRSASQAIGYQEIRSAIEHNLDPRSALIRDSMCTRTRRLAKRQQTWFRHQHETHWIDVSTHTSAESTADAVASVWSAQGPVLIEYPDQPL